MAPIRIGGGRRGGGMGRGMGGRFGALKMRLIIAVVIALFSVGSYYLMPKQTNPITGKDERVKLTTDDEIALGLQALPGMVQEFGGEFRDPLEQQRLDRICARLLDAAERHYAAEHPGSQSPREVYDFEFTILADPQTINAFALPGGQTFVTWALYQRMDDGMIAGVMGHEIGHVIERHGAERMAKQGMIQGVAAAGGVLTGDATGAQAAGAMMGVLQAGYGRDQERECDDIGYHLMVEAGYDPRAMVDVMNLLAEASGGAGGRPSVLSTHPDPGERAKTIAARIEQDFPDGVPSRFER